MSILSFARVTSTVVHGANRETELVVNLLLQECRMLPDVIKMARVRNGGDEELARIDIARCLPPLALSCIPTIPDRFIDAATTIVIDRACWPIVADAVANVWTVDAISEYEAVERDEIESRIEAMEEESRYSDEPYSLSQYAQNTAFMPSVA